MPTRRQALLAGSSVIASATLAGCLGVLSASPTDEDQTTTEEPRGLQNGSFEDGLAGWTVGRDLPEDPGGAGEPVESTVTTTDRLSNTGSRALLLQVDGSADDGTVWVQQSIDRSAYDTLSVSVYSEEASFNKRAEVAVYAGAVPEGDLVEREFDRSNQAGGHEGWTTFEYPVEGDGPGVVAVGTNVVWETQITTVLDDVRLR